MSDALGASGWLLLEKNRLGKAFFKEFSNICPLPTVAATGKIWGKLTLAATLSAATAAPQCFNNLISDGSNPE